jgi:putative ABC transport system ATP-binding protein
VAVLLELKHLKKVYNLGQENEFTALKGIDLNIDKGDFVAIMGPSGSGKSTLMNILGALDRPTSGKYIVGGEDISGYSKNQLADFRNRDVGFIFQQFNLLPRLSVQENVLLPTLYGHINNPDAKMLESLAKVGLSSKRKSKPNQLSGGEMQRVAIARALMMNPSIIMADEPTGNLDTTTSFKIMDVFTQLHKEGNTILLITHEPDIAKFASRIIHLRDGLITKQ